jgi:predicted amidohydrolase YtcJ
MDLGGLTVIPGLIDAHFHILATGTQLLTIDLAGAKSVPEVLELLEARAGDGDSEWLIAGHLDDEHPGARLPTLTELDRAFPRRPLFIEHRSCHFALCNTKAIEHLHLPDAARANGVLDGQLVGIARQRLMEVQGEAFIERSLRAACLAAARRGATTLHAMEGGDLFGDSALNVLERIRDSLATDVVVYWCGTDVGRAIENGFERVGGDSFVDGTLGSSTAALRFPYADDKTSRGSLQLSEQEVADFFSAAAVSHLQSGLHVIGGRAIETALRGIERALPKADEGARWRLEHCGDVSKAQLRRVAQLGVCISTQPAFTYLRGGPGGVYAQRVGPQRARRLYPLRWMLDEGIHVGGGSDSPITPADSLLGLESCVNARYSAQRTTPLEALQVFTSGAAWCAGEEATKGDLVPGMQADLLVLKESPLTCPPDRIQQIPIGLVMRRGLTICGPLMEGDGSWH